MNQKKAKEIRRRLRELDPEVHDKVFRIVYKAIKRSYYSGETVGDILKRGGHTNER